MLFTHLPSMSAVSNANVVLGILYALQWHSNHLRITQPWLRSGIVNIGMWKELLARDGMDF